MTWSAARKSAEHLVQILDEEFDALKAQNLDAFEQLQGQKVTLIANLAEVSPPQSGQEASEWAGFQDLILGCRDRHRRNSLLIQKLCETFIEIVFDKIFMNSLEFTKL